MNNYLNNVQKLNDKIDDKKEIRQLRNQVFHLKNRVVLLTLIILILIVVLIRRW